MLEDTRSLLSRPSTLYHPGFTGVRYPVISNVTLVENIYAAFFHYCHFDTNLPIPESLLLVCAEKPSSMTGYRRDWSMIDKIEFMKMNGKQYLPENLEQLMTIIRNQHRVDIDPPRNFSQVDAMRDLLEYYVQTDSPVIEGAFRRHLFSVINHFNPMKMVEEPRPELDTLKNYLAKANERMYYTIVDFMDRYGNLEDAKFSALQDWLMSPGTPKSASSLVNKALLYKTTQNVKNMIYNMSRLYPQMILQQKIYNRIPDHWDLADVHVRDLEHKLDKYWGELQPFFGDTVLSELLQDVVRRLNDLCLFVRELPVYSPIAKGDRLFHSLFDVEATYLMFMYLLYSGFYEYIVATENSDIINTDRVVSKNMRKKNIKTNKDVAESVTAIISDLEEDEEEAQQNLEEINLEIIAPNELKTRVAQVLMAVITIEQENQDVFLTYEEISKKIGFSKKEEKKRITDYLGSLQDDERKIEDKFKQYKMGRWNAGMQRGLVHYDKQTYQRERAEMDMGVFGGDMGTTAVDVETLEAEEARDIAEEYDAEGGDIGDFGDEYGDGVYYAEDRDPDDQDFL
jgi:hypothetical protein